MAQLKGLADFGRISEELTKILEETPAEYLLRVCIRFWQHSDQQLIEKSAHAIKPGILKRSHGSLKRLGQISNNRMNKITLVSIIFG